MKKFLALLLAVMMVLSLVACGAPKEDEQDAEDQQQEDVIHQDEEKNDAEDTEPVADGEDDYVFDIKEDDHTVVITTDDVIMVFTHDGENVTGYTGYVDCGSAANAKTRVAEVKAAGETYFDEEGIKSVTAKGKYAVVEYTEKAFEVTTYEELHNLAEMLKQVQQ